MKKLIICEKPSLARNVCEGLKLNGEVFKKEDGYYCSDNYVVTQVFGHLFSLYDMYDYTGIKEWTIDTLPFVPEKFRFKLKEDYKTKKVDQGVKKQFDLIKKLVHDKDTEAIVNCGDADREGEIIIRIVLNAANNTKPVYRLWLPEQTEETIAAEVMNMKTAEVYDALAEEGYARMYVDWLYGINYTRYATVLSNTLLRVGRVITPIVKTIYDRDKEIEKFVSTPYYQLVSKEETNGHVVELVIKDKYDNKFDKDMNDLLERLNNSKFYVSNIDEKEKIIQSPKLFSQSDLQNYLAKRFKYSPSKTLQLTQSLYEKGYCSYPRTPTNYLSSNEKEKINNIILKLAIENIEFKESKRIFDDAKIESHSAIIPTNKVPGKDILKEDEMNCYQAILSRFCAVFCSEDLKVSETTLQVSNGEINFELKGTIIINKGFLMFDEHSYKSKDKVLPKLDLGTNVETFFQITEKMTTAPKNWSVETLNNYLKNPYKKDNDTEDEEYKNILSGLEIGTEATRSGIIDNAINSEYISLSNNTYRIASKGVYLVESLSKLNILMDSNSTALLGAELKKIFHKKLTISALLKQVEEQLQKKINKDVEIEKRERVVESIGVCPLCKKRVVETNKAFSCEDRDCRFTIWKETNFITKIGKKNLTQKMVSELCAKQKVNVKGLMAKSGNKYDVEIILEIGDKYINLKPNFNTKGDGDSNDKF